MLGRSAAKDQAVGGTASLVFVVSTPRYGFAVFIYTCPLFLHTSAVVNHAGSVPGVQGQPFRLLAQRMSGSAFGGLWPPRLIALSAHNHAFASARHPLRRWEPFSLGFARGALFLRFSVVTGPVGPDPGGRLCPHTAGLCRRPGAWGLPSVVPSKPVIPHALMLQTASGATLHSLRSFRAIGGL